MNSTLYFVICNFRLEKRKNEKSGCLEITSTAFYKDPQLTDLEQRLEERKRERLAEQQRQKASLGSNSKSAQMVRRLSKEKVRPELLGNGERTGVMRPTLGPVY